MVTLRLTRPHELKNTKSGTSQSRRQSGNRYPHSFVKATMNDNDQRRANHKCKPANIIIHAKPFLELKPLIHDAGTGERNARDHQANEPG